MKLIESIARRFTKSASQTAKAEVKKTAIDLLPIVLTVVTSVAGVVLFHGSVKTEEKPKPYHSSTSITTNNYFFRDMTEDSIKRILDEK